MRERSENFTPYEKAFLIETVGLQASVIENKATDANISSQKSEKWREICEEFRRNENCKNRDVTQLSNCWKKMKQVRLLFLW